MKDAENTEPQADQSSKTSEERRNEPGFTLFADILGRYNPNGVVLYAGGAYRFLKHWNDDYRTLDHSLSLGLLAGVNPAYAQGGVFLEWLPAAFAVLRLQTDSFGFFGANGGLLSLPTRQSSFSDRALKRRIGEEEVQWGQRLMAQVTLRAKVGRVVLRNQTEASGYWFGGAGPYLLEMEYDVLLKTEDLLVTDRPALLVDLLDGSDGQVVLLGPFYDIAAGIRSRSTHQRLGLLLYAEPWVSVAGFDRPRFYVLSGTHLQAKNRPWGLFAIAGIGCDFDL